MKNHYVNVSASSFETVKAADYVDKSMLINIFNSFLNTSKKLVCISRPRRFGKTSAVKMLAAYYNCELDSHYLFDDLQIAQTVRYESSINKYNVLFMDISEFIINAENKHDIIKSIHKNICDELHKKFPETKHHNTLFEVLSNITSTDKKFIILIDEWDAVFRECADNIKLQEEYIELLRSLFKTSRTDDFLAGAYMTGILPIKKYGTHSALNNFKEFTMLSPEPFSRYIGFTEGEVQSICQSHNLDFSLMQKWYDGYVFNKLHIYNPESVQMVLLTKRFKSYWTETETYFSLKKYIKMNFDGLRDCVALLVNKGSCKINTRNFQNDMTSINSKDDVLTLLVHLGYLAFDEDMQEVYIPNEEILEEFKNVLDEQDTDAVVEMYKTSEQLKKAILSKDEEQAAKIIDDIHMRHTSIIKYNDENSLANIISIGFMSLTNDYTLIREMPAGKGFADIVAIPLVKPELPMLIVELKWNQDAQTAIEQIRAKEYPKALEGRNGEIILVGINYDKSTKKHECKIEEWIKEEYTDF